MSTIGALARNPQMPAMTRGPVRMRVGGSMGAGDPGQGGGHAGPSGAGGSRTSGGSVSSGRPGGVGNQGQTNSAPSAPASPASVGNSVTADKYVMDKYIADPDEGIDSERDYWSAVGNIGKRYVDFQNKDNTPIDKLGNFLAGLASIGEMDPTRQTLGASIDNPVASWGVDPLGAAATIGGMITGVPLGSLYQVGKKITGWEGPMIAFDGNPYQNQFSNSPTSPMLNGGSTIGGLGSGATAQGKGDQSGNGAGLGAVPALLNPAGAAPLAPEDDPAAPDDATPPAPAQPNMHPYLGDPLHYGETLGGWNFWPDGRPVVNAADGGSIRGAGDGQSDEIPALLSNNEHVIDAATVALAGRGDSEAGHRAIEKWKMDVRRRAGMKNPKKAPVMGSIGSLARAA